MNNGLFVHDTNNTPHNWLSYVYYLSLFDEHSVSPHFGNVALLFSSTSSISFTNEQQKPKCIFCFHFHSFWFAVQRMYVSVVLVLTKTTGAPETFLKSYSECVCEWRPFQTKIVWLHTNTHCRGPCCSFIRSMFFSFFLFCSFNKSFIISEDCSFFGYLIASLFCENLFSLAAAGCCRYVCVFFISNVPIIFVGFHQVLISYWRQKDYLLLVANTSVLFTLFIVFFF